MNNNESPVILQLEGRLVNGECGELKRICESLLSLGSTVVLDLADISFADANGIEALMRLRDRGVELQNPTLLLKDLMGENNAR